MNLLYTLTAYPPSTGGAQLHQHMLARSLSERHRVQVVTQWNENRTDWLLGTTLRAPAAANDYVIDGISVHRFGLSSMEKAHLIPPVLTYHLMMDRSISTIADCFASHFASMASQSDLIHNARVGREGLSYASYQSARRNGIPFVFTPLHHPRWVGWRYRAYTRLYQLADAVIALTDSGKAALVDLGVEPDRIHVTGIGPVLAPEADPLRFLRLHGIDGPLVLFLGQHYPYKGYRALLEATDAVWRIAPETHFVFIGPAVRNSEAAFRTHTDRRIHRLGRVPIEQKTDALSACTLLCVPSTQESFGGVYTEAWSLGKPVVGCNIPAVSDVIDDGINGRLVAQDPREIADAICELITSTGLARRLGENGKRKVESRYCWPRIAERTEDAYRCALSGSCR
ncbi:MAG: glycosyltransferase family 4 protein [Anaerolineae bacterium]|nr:glycosyltransferase family 4 protein [Anaerolineae bacterium]